MEVWPSLEPVRVPVHGGPAAAPAVIAERRDAPRVARSRRADPQAARVAASSQEAQQAALESYEADKLAVSAQSSACSLIKTWCRLRASWFGADVAPLPLKPAYISAVAASMKAAGDRSYPNDLSRMKQLHL